MAWRRPYEEDKVLQVVEEIQSGAKLAEVCSKHGVSRATVHRWRQRRQNSHSAELGRIKELEEDNAKLMRIVGHQSMIIDALKDLLKGSGEN